jgi:type I restriction enzyme M protein
MPKESSTDFKQTLWKTADSLRAQMDAAEYKHIVLGLIFLKYISDSFTEQKERIKALVTDPKSDFFISENLSDINEKDLEDRDYYTQDNVFWVPESARWETLRAQGKQPDIGAIIDRAMSDIETENKSLKGKLDKRFGRTELGAGKLGELIDLISTIGFTEEQNAGDMLGEVYEYFLGQFASAEGKKGGQFYTPRHVVKTLVAVLSPHKGRVYDPCCGSGGMFIQSEDFVTSHGGKRDDISIYGQESNPTTWRLAAMNLAIRGLAADLGKEPGDTFGNDQHPDTKFDYIIANPPFNISDWGGEKYEDDPRWVYGRPPVGNANYAWLQHMLWKLGPGGQAGVVLANGSMSSNTGGEGDIRKSMIEGDVVEIMIALPGQLFLNTQIPVCLWFLTNDKTKNGRNRKQETLFIDARDLGTMETRILKVLTDEDIQKIQDTVSSWRTGNGYEDIDGYCKSSTTEEIKKNNFILTPGRYVGYADDEDDDVSISQKLEKLVEDLNEIFIEEDNLNKKIKNNLKNIGFENKNEES